MEIFIETIVDFNLTDEEITKVVVALLTNGDSGTVHSVVEALLKIVDASYLRDVIETQEFFKQRKQ